MAQEELWTNDGAPIYLDATKIRVVEETSPDAAFLLVAEGGQIPMSVAKQYGLTEKRPDAAGQQTTMDDAAAEQTTMDDAAAERLEAERLEAERLEAERLKRKAAPATKLRETPDNKTSGQG